MIVLVLYKPDLIVIKLGRFKNVEITKRPFSLVLLNFQAGGVFFIGPNHLIVFLGGTFFQECKTFFIDFRWKKFSFDNRQAHLSFRILPASQMRKNIHTKIAKRAFGNHFIDFPAKLNPQKSSIKRKIIRN